MVVDLASHSAYRIDIVAVFMWLRWGWCRALGSVAI